MVSTRGAIGRAQAGATKQASTIIDVEPFRFLDLPPEIRVRIYTFHLRPTSDVTQIYDLADLKEPAIAAVSKLVRQESLAVFFAEASFEVYVGADLWERVFRNRAHAGPVDSKYAGTLNIKRSVLRRIRYSLKEAVVLRDVTYKVCDCLSLREVKNWKMSGVQKIRKLKSDVRVRFDVTSGLEVTAVTAPRIVNIVGIRDSHGRALNDAMDRVHKDVKRAAEEVVGRDGFIGFTVKDLEQIAKVFRMPERDVQ